jgi:hypothetical protein
MMAVESADDRAIFVGLNDFGTSATFTHSGTSATVSGIFDNDFVEVDAGGGVPFAMQQPRFVCRTSDVSNAVEDDTLVISAVTYKIKVRQDDGTGMTTLLLEKQ